MIICETCKKANKTCEEWPTYSNHCVEYENMNEEKDYGFSKREIIALVVLISIAVFEYQIIWG